MPLYKQPKYAEAWCGVNNLVRFQQLSMMAFDSCFALQNAGIWCCTQPFMADFYGCFSFWSSKLQAELKSPVLFRVMQGITAYLSSRFSYILYLLYFCGCIIDFILVRSWSSRAMINLVATKSGYLNFPFDVRAAIFLTDGIYIDIIC
jgi:hypothetical protein